MVRTTLSESFLYEKTGEAKLRKVDPADVESRERNRVKPGIIRLAIDKGNPQSNHFWKKNGFIVQKEVDRNGWTVLVAEKKI